MLICCLGGPKRDARRKAGPYKSSFAAGSDETWWTFITLWHMIHMNVIYGGTNSGSESCAMNQWSVCLGECSRASGFWTFLSLPWYPPLPRIRRRPYLMSSQIFLWFTTLVVYSLCCKRCRWRKKRSHILSVGFDFLIAQGNVSCMDESKNNVKHISHFARLLSCR